ncbi:hypothetical protein PTKIN_Ptkin14bG0179800 [Pterospermum kingtungense]
MSQIETLGILDEIQVIVSDKLQVVSYKWLSRNFLVSSAVAKRLLAEFVEKHGSALEVVYSLSGWLKNSPSNYHIQLVTGPKLSEAKLEYNGSCSVHVYSVQACIPKDPAALWNTEFIQAEELFKQPTTVDNCLRDNRFCGISTPFVKRNVDGVAAAQPNSVVISGSSKYNSAQGNSALPFQQNKVQQSSSKVAQQPSGEVKDVKSDSIGRGVHDLASKHSPDIEKIPSLPSNKIKGQKDKSSTGNGGSLANLWGRASTKPKPSDVPENNGDSIQNPNVSADAQICAREAVEDENSDDDAQKVNFRRASNGQGNKKRRVVFDLSDEDEYEDAVNLASPDPPKRKSSIDSEQNSKTLIQKMPDLIVDKPNKDEVKVKEERTINKEPNILLEEETSVASKSTNGRHSSSVKVENQHPDSDLNKKNKVADAAPNSPKRRKVLKTRIDERGREVNEVVWEGEETEGKNIESDMPKKVKSSTTNANKTNIVTNPNNRPAAAKKSPAVGSTAPSNPGGKAGNKKAGNSKDPKQGNILSFFKRV